MTAERLLEELAAADCYPDRATDVRIIQTHLSVVCLTDERVYKLKKAVTLPFVDFGPRAARLQACRDEVRLNRRLCPDTYLGTSTLRRVDGQLRFGPVEDVGHPSAGAGADADAGTDGGAGGGDAHAETAEPLDHAVVMRRLPQERMLDELVDAGNVTAHELRELARLVADFHRGADRSAEITATGHPDKLAGFARDNFDELADVDCQLPADLLRATGAASERAFAALLPTLRRRADEGRVVDGHGDLHARNICMTAPPTVYDCIEFEPAFRCGDVATEVAFLVMDLRYRAADGLAGAFVQSYVDASGDDELPSLLPILCSYRAMVRGKVAALSSTEAELPDAQRQQARDGARRHLLLAAGCAAEAAGPRWLLVCGPPASGKSLLASRLAAACRWPHLQTDVVRKQLAGLRPEQRAEDEHYTPEFSRRTYRELLRRAGEQTRAGRRIVLLDGNFADIARRDEARRAAADAGAQLLPLHLDIDVDTAVARATARQRERGNASDADADVARRLHGAFVPPTTAEGPLCTLDGTRDVDELLAAALSATLERRARDAS